MKRKIRYEKGFTLVELSIVLVIIGLIVASVLVGQDLIRQGELRANVTQFEQYAAASGAFKTKYGGLPGDVSGTRFFEAGSGANLDGNGNGLLSAGTYTVPPSGFSATSENLIYWAHLGSNGASLINGSFAVTGDIGPGSDLSQNFPAVKTGGFWGAYADSGSNYLLIGADVPVSVAHFRVTHHLAPLDALSIDTKLDDGQPNRGVVLARGQGLNGAAIPTWNATPGVAICMTGGTGATDITSRYNTLNETEQCALAIRLSLK